MRTRKSIVAKNLSELVKNQNKYDFTTFLKKIRSIYSIGRKVVEQDTGISHMKLVYFEGGYFMHVPDSIDLLTLSVYFEIDEEILLSKAVKFIAEGKSTPYKPYKISRKNKA